MHASHPDRQPRADLLKRLASEQGFELVGIAPAEPSRHADAYRRWIAEGRHGSMDYLAGNLDERLDLTRRLPWAKTVLCVGLAYYQDVPPAAPEPEPAGRVARYAWGRDYHRVLGHKLAQIEKRLRAEIPEPFHARAYTDTGPLLEREFAARAGLGWIGKHTLLIHPRHGSWFLLGELVLSLDLAFDSPLADHCGTCTRCIQACPTGAITPYSVDGARCISYLTLEDRAAEIPPAFHLPMAQAGFVAGCDICQEVCPHNRQPLPCATPDFAPRPPAPQLPLAEILAWSEQDWDIHTRGRASRRARFAMWQRNARILAHPEPDA